MAVRVGKRPPRVSLVPDEALPAETGHSTQVIGKNGLITRKAKTAPGLGFDITAGRAILNPSFQAAEWDLNLDPRLLRSVASWPPDPDKYF